MNNIWIKFQKYNLKLCFFTYFYIYVCISVDLRDSCLLGERMDTKQISEDNLVCYSICGFHELNSGFQYSAANESSPPEPPWCLTTIVTPYFPLWKRVNTYLKFISSSKSADNILCAGLIGLHHHIWLLKRLFLCC